MALTVKVFFLCQCTVWSKLSESFIIIIKTTNSFQHSSLQTFKPSILHTFQSAANLPTFSKSVWKQKKRQTPLNTQSVKKQEKQQNPLNMTGSPFCDAHTAPILYKSSPQCHSVHHHHHHSFCPPCCFWPCLTLSTSHRHICQYSGNFFGLCCQFVAKST